MLEQARARTGQQQQQLAAARSRVFELEQELASYRGAQHARRASPLADNAALREDRHAARVTTKGAALASVEEELELEQARRQVELLLQRNQALDLQLREAAAEVHMVREEAAEASAGFARCGGRGARAQDDRIASLLLDAPNQGAAAATAAAVAGAPSAVQELRSVLQARTIDTACPSTPPLAVELSSGKE